ncbi:hypothetical protein F4860DRAFT_492783 [Xylaria cubensis]|nr:hypothetical protein F4860DRAFT_492783 [Xylaria cubensis]
MGQTFRLTAPRAKLTTKHCYGKLGEILFGNRASILVHLLAVPLRPPPDSPQNPPVDSANTTCGEKRGIKRVRDENDVHTESSQRRKTKAQDRDETVTLFSLPLELHRLIFSFIVDIDDVLCFGMTNQYFLRICHQFWEHYYMSCLGRWAGKNIVCVGEDVEPHDYPPGLFSSEEIESLRQTTIKLDEDGYLDEEDGYPNEEAVESQPFTLWHFTQPGVSMVDKFQDFGLYTLGCDLERRFLRRKLYRDPALTHLEEQFSVDDETYFPTGQRWILRNLTTKQIVRSDAIALSPDHISGPNIKVFGFGEVLLSRICWSTNPVMFPSSDTFTRGIWAGHRFDITTLSRHEVDTQGEEWTDVSDEVAREVASIWEGCYGPDWREELIKKHR